jgi:hypothetical protein
VCRRPSRSIPIDGVSTFAETPARPAPDARILWHAALDPGTLRVVATPADPAEANSVRLDHLAPWLTLVRDAAGHEHAVLSDGLHRIRLDVEEGSLGMGEAVLLHYQLMGIASAAPKILPLRRLLHLCRRRRFARSLFPPDPRVARWLLLLRVHDGLVSGASRREIAAALFGIERVAAEWPGASDSLRSQVKRLARDARAMARGGYRSLMRRGHR